MHYTVPWLQGFVYCILAFGLAATPMSALSQSGALEEVIVTAEKRATSLQDTAIAVTAFTGTELDRALINKALDLQFNVPNMLVSQGVIAPATITLRGIGNLAVGSTADSGTGSHFNGVYLNGGRIIEMEYYDAERVEVLRGPQGTLYGRNTTAGVMNFITRKPDDEFGGDFTLEAGNYDYYKLKGALNIPITEQLAQRFSVFYTARSGYVENLYTGNDIDGRDMYSLRSGTRWHNDAIDATLTINYFREQSDRLRGSNLNCKRDPDGIIGCLPTGKGTDTPHSGATVSGFMTRTVVGPLLGVEFPEDDFLNSPRSSDPRELWLDFEPRYDVEDLVVALEFNWDIGATKLTSLTGYHNSDQDTAGDFDMTVASEPWPIEVTVPLGADGFHTTDRAYNTQHGKSDPEQWSQELRLASNFDGNWNFLIGAFYLHYESEDVLSIYSAAIEAAGEVLGIDPALRLYRNEADKYELDTYAAFGELYWQARDDVAVTLGMRFTHEEKKSRQRTTYLNFLDNPLAEDGGYNEFDGQWEEPTGKLNVSWDATEQVMAYVTLSRSYKSGGFNPVSPESPLLDPAQGGDPDRAEFDPEYINAIELGLKSRLLDNTLQANVTYFYYDYQGLQVGKITNQTSINENYDATIQGFEGEFIYVPDLHWRFSLNLAWLDTEIADGQSVDPADINLKGTTENTISSPFANVYIGPDCPTGTATCDGLPKSLSGNELPNAPEFSVNLGIAYRWQLPGNLQLVAASNYYWQDAFYTRVFNAVNDRVDGWNVWNATLTLTSVEQGWYAELWGRNLVDDDSITGQTLGDQNLGLGTYEYLLEPRTYGASFGYQF